MPTKATRKRKPRQLETTNEAGVNPELKQLAAEFHRENTAMNSHKRKAEKARKALYAGMKQDGLTDFNLITNIEGRDISLEATITARESTVIDVEALRKIVSEEQFLNIISATKTNVEKFAGSDVCMRVSSTKKGTENVSVKPKK